MAWAIHRATGKRSPTGWSMLLRWTILSFRAVRSGMRDDFGIAASSIAFAAFLAIIPLIGLIAGTYGVFVPPATVARNLATLTAIMPLDARQTFERWCRPRAPPHSSTSTGTITP